MTTGAVFTEAIRPATVVVVKQDDGLLVYDGKKFHEDHVRDSGGPLKLTVGQPLNEAPK